MVGAEGAGLTYIGVSKGEKAAALAGGAALLVFVVVAEVVRHSRKIDDGLPPGVRLEVTPSSVPGRAASVFLELDEGAYGRWMRHVPLTIEIERILPPFSFPIEKGPNSMTTEFNEPTAVTGHAYVVRGRDPDSGARIEILRKVLR